MRISSLNTYTASRMNQSFKAEPLSSYTIKEREDFGRLEVFNITSSPKDLMFLESMKNRIPIEKLKPEYSEPKKLFCKNLIENGIKCKLNNVNTNFLLAVKNQKPVGIMIYDKSKEDCLDSNIKYLATWSSVSGKSSEAAGTCLMNELFLDSKNKGVRRISVTPPANFIETAVFYSKMGFEYMEEEMFCNLSFMEIFKKSIEKKLHTFKEFLLRSPETDQKDVDLNKYLNFDYQIQKRVF